MKKTKIALVILSTMLLLTGVVSYADTVNAPSKIFGFDTVQGNVSFAVPAMPHPGIGFAFDKNAGITNINLEDYKDLTVSEKKEKLLSEFKTALEKWNGEDALIFEASNMDKAFIQKFESTVADDMLIDLPQNFDEKTLAAAKEKFLKSLTENIDAQVKANILTQEEADKQIAELKATLEKWDGKSPLSLKIGKGGMMFYHTIQDEEQQ